MQPLIAAPAIFLLLFRAWHNSSLTPLGLVFAGVTATIHALHPWSVFFALLGVFFIGGTATTKVKHREKAKLTHSSTGEAGGEGPRNHIQVLANSLVASVLIALHAWQLRRREQSASALLVSAGDECWAWGPGADVLVVGIVAQYAAAAADTWASELGILSKSPPRLITSLTLRVVPPGTNGGVSAVGTLAGFAGAMTIALTSLLLLPFCSPSEGKVAGIKMPLSKGAGLQGGTGWGFTELCIFVAAVTVWGGLGSLLDSILGATLQSTVIDAKTGRVIEGHGGRKVLVRAPTGNDKAPEAEPSRKVVSGLGLLDNNGVNFVTSLTMAVGAMVLAAGVWGVPMGRVLA